jgi:hypothetical protein
MSSLLTCSRRSELECSCPRRTDASPTSLSSAGSDDLSLPLSSTFGN